MTTTLAPDHFTRPLVDLDDVAARIGAAVAFVTDRIGARVIPADLALTLDCAREALADLGKLRTPKSRAKAFRDEHGVETLKDLSFAMSDHAALLAADLDDDLVEVQFSTVRSVGEPLPRAVRAEQHDAHADAWLDAINLNSPSGYRAA